MSMDDIDRKIIRATQAGLPLTGCPYQAVAETLGLDPQEVTARLRRMVDVGIIRRIGAVPNHYALGLTANGMSVWDVEDAHIDKLGARIGGLDFVSHCYHRPRVPPVWPYNLFAMVHGRSREEVHEKVGAIAALLGSAARAHDVLFSTRILKKTGLRLGPVGDHRTGCAAAKIRQFQERGGRTCQSIFDDERRRNGEFARGPFGVGPKSPLE